MLAKTPLPILMSRIARTFHFGLLATFIGLTAPQLHAQEKRFIKMVVPYAAGGISDQAARILGERMSMVLNETLIIDNKPGGGSRIGTMAVASAPADGDTVLFTNMSFSTLPLTDSTVRYDPVNSFAPVGVVATLSGAALVVRPSPPAKNLEELVTHARAHPGQLSYGSSGIGSGAHFIGEYLKALTGTNITHVPYRSTVNALNDVAAGQIDMTFDASAKPLIDAGKVRVLALVAPKRDPRMPNVPTIAEAGVKGLDINGWIGVLAPQKTPQATVEKINRAMNVALQDPELRKRYQELGLVPAGGSPARMTQQLREDAALYRKVITQAKLKFD
ncbi:Bug family tripartite tricarboxylate transporter substrate binding protein [Cupriavidus basilensis]